MYSLVPEKPLRLVYEPFYIVIKGLFKDFYGNEIESTGRQGGLVEYI